MRLANNGKQEMKKEGDKQTEKMNVREEEAASKRQLLASI